MPTCLQVFESLYIINLDPFALPISRSPSNVDTAANVHRSDSGLSVLANAAAIQYSCLHDNSGQEVNGSTSAIVERGSNFRIEHEDQKDIEQSEGKDC